MRCCIVVQVKNAVGKDMASLHGTASELIALKLVEGSHAWLAQEDLIKKVLEGKVDGVQEDLTKKVLEQDKTHMEMVCSLAQLEATVHNLTQQLAEMGLARKVSVQ